MVARGPKFPMPIRQIPEKKTPREKVRENIQKVRERIKSRTRKRMPVPMENVPRKIPEAPERKEKAPIRRPVRPGPGNVPRQIPEAPPPRKRTQTGENMSGMMKESAQKRFERMREKMGAKKW